MHALRAAARAAWARGAPDVAAGFLRRAAQEELPRGELVPLLRELARALIATEGPIGFPVMREALALSADDERAEIALELGRALFTQGYFTEACAALEAAGADSELAAIAVLDLSLVRRFGGLDALKPAGASAVGAWIEVARDPTADGAAHAEAALADPDLEPAGLPAGLVALMAAGRLEQADAIWSDVAETARASAALDMLRLAVTLRAIVRLRLGRIADAEADLRELIAWVGELEVPFAEYRTALPWVIAPLVDALVERGELDEAQHWVALTGLEAGWPELFGFTFLLDSLARLRLAQGRVQDALAAGARVRPPPARVGHPQPRASSPGARRSPRRSPRPAGWPRRSTCATSRSIGRAPSASPAKRAWRCSRSAASPATRRRSSRRSSSSRPPRPGSSTPARCSLWAGASRCGTALELAERCGATALAASARDALVAAGARPRRAQLTGAAALTASQRAKRGTGRRRVARIARSPNCCS